MPLPGPGIRPARRPGEGPSCIHLDALTRDSPTAHTHLMLARVRSASLQGIDGRRRLRRGRRQPGCPRFTTVGLPDSAVRESRDRVRAAIRNGGLRVPAERITVNLAPADLRKEGAAFDLPMAVGILAATGLVKPDRLDLRLVLGELSLDGRVCPVRGVLPVAAGLPPRRASLPCWCPPAMRGGRRRSAGSASSPSPPCRTRSTS